MKLEIVIQVSMAKVSLGPGSVCGPKSSANATYLRIDINNDIITLSVRHCAFAPVQVVDQRLTQETR